jgi:hypothetical protein
MRYIGTPIVLVACFLMALTDNPSSRSKASEEAAWKAFSAAVRTLQEKGDRNYAGKLFRQVAATFPESRYAKDSKELGVLLEAMVVEDAQWKEPEDPERLNPQERIDYFIHHLRDVNCEQFFDPGMCNVLQGDKSKYAAAIQLKEIGKPAIPALIALLEDRRSTRSVGFVRTHGRSCTVLRYQDAVIQILNELLPTRFYRRSRTGAYLSNEPAELRERVIKNIKAWQRQTVDKDELAKKWVAAELDLGIYPTLELLAELSKEPGQRKRVTKRLHQLAKEKSPLQLPQISFLLCKLGDKSLLNEVENAYYNRVYHTGRPQALWDDGCASLNATDYAIKQFLLYGDKACWDRLTKGMTGKTQSDADVMLNLFDLARNRFGALPAEYDKSHFPLSLLVLILKLEGDSKPFYASPYQMRWCDRAAEAIQLFTGQSFGFDKKDTIEDKNAAIARILAWWDKKSTEQEDGQ